MKKDIHKYMFVTMIFIFSIILTNPTIFKESVVNVAIIICQFIKIVLSFANFTMVLISLGDCQNNREVILAHGYFGKSIFILMNTYMYAHLQELSHIEAYYYKSAMIIQILEGISLYVVLAIVDEKQNIKKWNIGMISIFILCLVAVAIPISQERYMYWSKTVKIHDIASFVIIGMLIVGVIQNFKRYGFDKEERLIWYAVGCKILIACITKIFVTELGSLVLLSVQMIQLLQCIQIYRFIYYRTITRVWKKTDHYLTQSEQKLKEEEIEKHNLIFASYALENYMQRINSKIDIVKKRLEKIADEENISFLEKMRKNCQRLIKLSKNILDLIQMDIGNISSECKMTNMNQLVQVLLESILPYSESKQIKIEVNMCPETIFCYVDPDEMERVLLNLISNAIKYNKKGGTIKIHMNQKQDKVFLCVEDTGIGISDENLQRIFDRFERVDNGLDRRQEGSGLGLCIVKSIVEMNEGTINIVSKKNESTLVSICLPIYEGKKVKKMDLRQKEVLKRKVEVEFSDLRK